MLDIPSISAVVASVGVLVGVTFAYLEVRTLVRQRETDIETRQAQLFMEIYDYFHSEKFLSNQAEILFRWKWKNYDDFMGKYGPEVNPDAYAKWDSLGTYYKGVGVLVKRELIDLNLVHELMSESILHYWEKLKPMIRGFREQYGFPKAWQGLEYLSNQMQKRE